jgi:hypothetical protein
MPTQEQRQVASFNRIALSGYGEIILTQGETESLVIETERHPGVEDHQLVELDLLQPPADQIFHLRAPA